MIHYIGNTCHRQFRQVSANNNTMLRNGYLPGAMTFSLLILAYGRLQAIELWLTRAEMVALPCIHASWGPWPFGW